MKNNFKKIVITIGVVLLLICGLAFSGYTYDTDPLVTLSYLNEVFVPQIKQDIIDAVLSYFEANSANEQEQIQQIPQQDETVQEIQQQETQQPQDSLANASYEVVELTLGQKLVATACAEVIMRPGGKVECVSQNDMGLCDVTGGTDIFNGQPLLENHYVIIPRADGRGVLCVSEKAYLLVRGGYVIE